MAVDSKPQINTRRFLQAFNKITSIGMDSSGAVNRLALTPEDIQARKVLVKELNSVGANVRTDDAGNIYGQLDCGSTGRVIAIGSHLDSVPQGGKFDGAYGVLAGLEILRTISEHKTKLKHNLLLIDFTNEEGARFTPGMAGSALATFRLPKEQLYNQTDHSGVSFKEALEPSNFLGRQKHRIGYSPPEAYLELHIEQGPTLYNSGLDIGVVEGIQGIVWLEATVNGQANHAGTTPMSERRDALVVAAKTIIALREFARSKDKIVATIGRVQIQPNTINIIAGQARFSIDLRSPSEILLSEGVEYTNKSLSEIARQEGVTFKIRELELYSPTGFNQTAVEAVERSASMRGYKHMHMHSGAGHDAQNMAKITKTGMIFIPSKEGISHSKNEHSSDEQLLRGLNTLLDAILYLDSRL